MLKIKIDYNDFYEMLNAVNLDVGYDDACVIYDRLARAQNDPFNPDVTADLAIQDIAYYTDVIEDDNDVFVKWAVDWYSIGDDLIFKHLIDKYLSNDLTVMSYFGGINRYDQLNPDEVTQCIDESGERDIIIGRIIDAINRETLRDAIFTGDSSTYVYVSQYSMIEFRDELATLAIY